MESMVCASVLITAAASLALPQPVVEAPERFSASDFVLDGGKQAECFESHPAVRLEHF
jgi:hypothetical protein